LKPASAAARRFTTDNMGKNAGKRLLRSTPRKVPHVQLTLSADREKEETEMVRKGGEFAVSSEN
jgi:hypothetical protein